MQEIIQPKAPFIDRVVGYFNPRAGAERQAWRSINNTYRGGVGDRLSRRANQEPSYNGQSISSRLQLFNARDRARDVDKNNFIGFGTLSRETDNVVADGPTLQSHTENSDFNKEVEDRWPEFMASCDITGMSEGASDYFQMQYRTGRRDGDVGEILTADDRGNPKLQIIPGDRICNPNNQANSPILVDGIELGSNGAPAFFHILDLDEYGKRKWTAVAARDFVFSSHRTDPFQIRGETCFMRCFDEIDILDRYVRGVGLAAWMATVFGIIFKEKNAGKNMQGLGYLTNSAGQQQRAITFEDGQMKYVGTDDDVVQVDAKQPMQQTPDFVRMLARLIGIPFDMPLELVLLDVSQANLSSLRGGLQQFYRACRKRRAKWIAGWDRKYQWWISRMVNAGKFTTPAPARYWPHEFKPVGWQFTDPIVQAQAAQLECDMGINSLQNVCDELGRDFETITRQREAAKTMTKGLPEVFSTLTREAQAKIQSDTTLAIAGEKDDTTDGPVKN